MPEQPVVQQRNHEIDLLDLLQIFWRRKRIFLWVFTIAFLVGAAIVLLKPQQYKFTQVVRLASYVPPGKIDRKSIETLPVVTAFIRNVILPKMVADNPNINFANRLQVTGLRFREANGKFVTVSSDYAMFSTQGSKSVKIPFLDMLHVSLKKLSLHQKDRLHLLKENLQSRLQLIKYNLKHATQLNLAFGQNIESSLQKNITLIDEVGSKSVSKKNSNELGSLFIKGLLFPQVLHLIKQNQDRISDLTKEAQGLQQSINSISLGGQEAVIQQKVGLSKNLLMIITFFIACILGILAVMIWEFFITKLN